MAASHKHPKFRNEEIGEENEEEEEEEEEGNGAHRHRRLCDFCGASTAVLYCRADSAKLCFSCDREVHSTNPLFSKHSRSQLCDSCNSKPSSIHCSTENVVLCQNCDWASHGRALSSLHDRRPLEGFTGCPSAIELSSFLGFEDLGKKSVAGSFDGCSVGSEIWGPKVSVDGFPDLLVWETPPIVSLDDLIVSTDSSQNFQALGIPPLPKNRKTACGKYKEEMIHQLLDMLKAENSLYSDFEEVEALLGFQPLVPAPTSDYYEASSLQWRGGCSEVADKALSGGQPEGSSLPPPRPNDAGVSIVHSDSLHERQSQNPVLGESSPVLPKVALRNLGNLNRDLSISRYKEKRKTRRYEKHIRYESRKARAESRTRIRGRFAKVEH